MLTNATLTSLARATATAAGKTIFTAEMTLNVPCAMSNVRDQQRRDLGQEIADATATLRVLKSAMGNIVPAKGNKLTAAVAGSAPLAYRIVFVKNAEKDGGLAAYVCFLKALLTGEGS